MHMKKQAGGTLLGVFVGIVLGVVIAAGIVWFLNRSNNPFSKDPRNERSEEAPLSGSQALDLPAKPGDKQQAQRFDFYKVLPGGGDTQRVATPSDSKDNAATAPLSSESFFLQAGSFQKNAEADNLKAKLALIGVEASITEANVPEKGKMYRVRSGPYAKADEMNRVRTQMSQAGIQASVIKTKE